MTNERPLPLADDATAPFWEACRKHELRMQQCRGCNKLRFPPRPMCPRCQSFESDWVLMSGRGTVYSFVVLHPPVLPAFQSRVPFPVILVELEEDAELRMVGNVMGDGLVEIGARVEVVFEDVTPEATLPQWRILR